jgi:hypothetical protein
MPVSERHARLDDDKRRRLTLVTPEWSTQEVAFADESIERFFTVLRQTYVDVGGGLASG